MAEAGPFARLVRVRLLLAQCVEDTEVAQAVSRELDTIAQVDPVMGASERSAADHCANCRKSGAVAHILEG